MSALWFWLMKEVAEVLFGIFLFVALVVGCVAFQAISELREAKRKEGKP